jgi:hypothetical protein
MHLFKHAAIGEFRKGQEGIAEQKAQARVGVNIPVSSVWIAVKLFEGANGRLEVMISRSCRSWKKYPRCREMYEEYIGIPMLWNRMETQGRIFGGFTTER